MKNNEDTLQIKADQRVVPVISDSPKIYVIFLNLRRNWLIYFTQLVHKPTAKREM